MTGHDFIALAGRLAASNDEAALRSAVSRAYYGAFHLAIAFLAELDCPTNGHGEPPRRLSEPGNENARLAGQLLIELQGARVKADYKLNDRRLAAIEFARHHVEIAHSIRGELDKCVGEDVRTAIKTEIARFLHKREGRM